MFHVQTYIGRYLHILWRVDMFGWENFTYHRPIELFSPAVLWIRKDPKLLAESGSGKNQAGSELLRIRTDNESWSKTFLKNS